MGCGKSIIEYFLRACNIKLLIFERRESMIYENVERIAKNNGIAITALEEKAELGRGSIGKWRKSNPTVENLRKVAKALDVPLEALLEE